jgi:adenosylcobinamide-GDP ribazoletransferase
MKPSGDMVRQWMEEAVLAFGLLTRFPLPSFERRSAASYASAFWAYPLAGGAVGMAGAVTFWLAAAMGFSTGVCVILALSAIILAEGGLHEDGVADFWDGLGGGETREEKLTIMRDSRIGTYGVIALLFTIGLQGMFLVNLHHYAGVGGVAAGLIASEAAARGVLAVPLGSMLPARADGLGQGMAELQSSTLAAGALIAAVIALLLLGVSGFAVMIGAAIGALFISTLAGMFLGGYTGDVLGASAATARAGALGALVLMVTP